MRRLALTGCLAVLAAAAGVTATAAPTAGTARPKPALRAHTVRVAAGATFVVRGTGFPHRARLVLRAGRPDAKAPRIGSARTGRLGTFRATIRVMSGTAPGAYVVRACRNRCRVKATLRFRVVRG